MGKDRSGKFHPTKGKPSGAAKEEGLGITPTDPEKMDQYLDITERYTDGEDELASHVPVRHPNRNTEKRHEGFRNQADDQDSRHDPHAFAEAHTQVVPEEWAPVVTKDVFAELANYRAQHCVTICLPTHAAGVEVNELNDRIAFKSALQEAAGELKTKGLNSAVIEPLLAPGYVLQKDEAFWRQQSKGLAVFIADGMCRYIKLPMDPGRKVAVNNSFVVTPLLPLFTTSEYYYVLVISKKQAKLFRADMFGMEHVNVPGLSSVDPGSGHPGEDPTAPNGLRGDKEVPTAAALDAGTKGDQDKARLAVYLEAIDDVIWKEVLHDKTVPLLLAGVEYLIPIYKTVTDYKHVCEDALTGSHERDELSTLYELSMKKMAYYFEQPLKKALALYNNQSATALTSSIIADVVAAVHYGRASHLFIQKGAELWGNFDEMKNELALHETKEAGSSDLYNKAVSKALLTGAEVYMLEKEKMPADSIMAAVMRY
ncbi:MAG TPA: hypothetical protein VD993_06255 [Chitinophagaceae bacterium]|nr:hypothetical protein [Chitinophagaceae bacterium]